MSHEEEIDITTTELTLFAMRKSIDLRNLHVDSTLSFGVAQEGSNEQARESSFNMAT